MTGSGAPVRGACARCAGWRRGSRSLTPGSRLGLPSLRPLRGLRIWARLRRVRGFLKTWVDVEGLKPTLISGASVRGLAPAARAGGVGHDL